MTTQDTKVGAGWALHEGAVDIPVDAGAVHLGKDGNWYARVGAGGHVFKRKAARQAVIGAGETAVGSFLNDAVIIDGRTAEDAAGSWTDDNGRLVPPGDVFDLVTPNSDIAGITSTVYVQFKSPPNAELYKYEPANQAGYFKATTVDQTKLSPVPNGAQQGNCNPPLVWDPHSQRCECPAGTQPDGKGGCVGSNVPAAGAGMSTGVKVALGVAAAAAVVGGGYLALHHAKKRRRHAA